MNTKKLGNIGEAKAIAEFVSRNITVCIPFGDTETFDFVIYQNNKFLKVQVKTVSKLTKSGCVNLKLTSRRYGVDYNYSKDEVDIFVVYCIETDKCYFVKHELIKSKVFHIKVKPSLIKTKEANYCKNFTFESLNLHEKT